MNLLYLSKLDDAPWCGPTYSIPRQIESQAQFDNVLWVNLRKTSYGHWKKLPFYQETEYSFKYVFEKIHNSFGRIDLAILEGIYSFRFQILSIVHTLRVRKIPFIFVPRGELTQGAQNYKHFKKIIANFLIVKRLLHDAIAIQYLTRGEWENSKKVANGRGIVIPNGTETKSVTKKKFSREGIKFVYVGRIHTYHKGIDLLLNAWLEIKDVLAEAKCTLDIYGPDRTGDLERFKEMVISAGLGNIVRFHDDIYGEEKEKKLLDADVFIMTSRLEGQPMGLIEALSYGVPCFVTTGTNMQEEIEEADAGWGTDNSVQRIEAVLLQVIQEKCLLPVKSDNAVALAQKYNWENIAHKAHIVYANLINNGKG